MKQSDDLPENSIWQKNKEDLDEFLEKIRSMYPISTSKIMIQIRNFEGDYDKMEKILYKTIETQKPQEEELIKVLTSNLNESIAALEIIKAEIELYLKEPKKLTNEKQIYDLFGSIKAIVALFRIMFNTASVGYKLTTVDDITEMLKDLNNFESYIEGIINNQMEETAKRLKLIGAAYSVTCHLLANHGTLLGYIELGGIDCFKEKERTGGKSLQKISAALDFILKNLSKIKGLCDNSGSSHYLPAPEVEETTQTTGAKINVLTSLKK